MKYVVHWTMRENTTEEVMKRGFDVFGRWQPSKGIQYHQHVGRVDGQGGYMVVETDDPELIAKEAALFTPYVRCEVTPVMDMEQFARVNAEAYDFRTNL